MPNRLAHESSPYLLQHADNPVDWYPWGEEARARARSDDRPILLSIGYSACHWCHVMERESFEDEAVAAVMNELFVNVKVDREERPDVDQVYMSAVQAITGRGGWPLTVFLTPDGDPYYGGTYFPPDPRHGLPSFRQVLEAASRAYRDRADEVRTNAAQLRKAVGSVVAAAPGTVAEAAPGEALLDEAVHTLGRQFDERHGGFGSAPKFPQPVTLDVLFRHHARTGSESSLHMAIHTLHCMARGGMHDHVGGGFHRYSVDARWLVPHFEKMLYDNALLARAYVDGYRVTGDADLRDVAERTLDWMLSDLGAPEGGFYAARDADSAGEEGLYYVWTPAEVTAVLTPERAALFMRCYDITEAGNFEGRSIPHLPHPLHSLAAALDTTPATLREELATARAELLMARALREPPLLDEKVIASWNGLALQALAEAGATLRRADYVEAAARGARFVLERMRDNDRLRRIHKDGVARIDGFLEDHAAVGNAMLSLHEATLDPAWAREARWFVDRTLERFWDDDSGTFFDAAHDAEPLFVRPRDPMDNATPSGNSLALELLLRCGHLFDESRYRDVARRGLAREAALMRRFPTAFGRLLGVLDRSIAAPVELAVIGRRDDPATTALASVAFERFHRNLTVTGRAPDESVPAIPLLEHRGMAEGSPTAWLCRSYACERPVGTPEALRDRFAEEASPSL